MTGRWLSLLALLMGTVSSAQQGISAPPSSTVVVRAARMLDVRGGGYVARPVIVIENGRISAVGSGLAVPEGARVMPLLVRAHPFNT